MQRPTQSHPRPRPDRQGARNFRHQRTTAVLLAVLVPLAVFFVANLAGKGHDEVKAALASPLVALPLAALVLAGTYHMWIGMHEIIEDYIHGAGSNRTLRMLNSAYALGMAVICLLAVAKLTLGSWS